MSFCFSLSAKRWIVLFLASLCNLFKTCKMEWCYARALSISQNWLVRSASSQTVCVSSCWTESCWSQAGFSVWQITTHSITFADWPFHLASSDKIDGKCHQEIENNLNNVKAECVISKVLYWIPNKYINRSRKKFNISRQDTKWNDGYSALSIFYLTGNYLKVISLGKKWMIYQCQLQRCSIHLGAFSMWQKIALFTLSILESTRRHKSIEVMTSPDKQHLLSWDKHKIIIQVAYIWVKKKSKTFPKSWNKNLMPIIYLQFQRSKVISCGTNGEKQSLERLKVLNLFLVHTLLLQLLIALQNTTLPISWYHRLIIG